jgi:hypothetical protein
MTWKLSDNNKKELKGKDFWKIKSKPACFNYWQNVKSQYFMIFKKCDIQISCLSAGMFHLI